MIILDAYISTNQNRVPMNFKNIIVLLIFPLFSLSHANGQELLSVKKIDFVNKSEQSNLAYSKINQAMGLHLQKPDKVDKYLPLFLEAYKYKTTSAELNYNIGVSYLIGNSKEKAGKYLLEAYKLNNTVSNDICYQIGLSHQYHSEFLKAIKMFQHNVELIVNARGDKNKGLIETCEKHINECINGLALQASPTHQTVSLLDDKVNSEYNDLNPIEEGNTFYFSSQRTVNSSDKLLEKVYSVSTDMDGNRNLKKENIPFGKYANVAMDALQGNHEYIFYSGINGGGDFILAKQTAGRWIANGNLPTVNSPASRESSACIAGNELYFVSNRTGSIGECDIYYCTKGKNGEWSKPKNIGSKINTIYNEADLYVTPDGKELYFNSKGHDSMGGFDIFKCVRLSNGKWSSPVNMGIPVNSPYNDIQYFKSKTGEQYFSSERNGGAGGFDIYTVGKVKEPTVADTKTQDLEKTTSSQDMTWAQDAHGIEQAVKEAIPELIYRIQILACKNEVNVDALYKIYSGRESIEQQYLDGWYKYAVGKFKSYKKAEIFKDSCSINGAFIVLFKNGLPLKLRR